MNDSLDERARVYSRGAQLQAYDISATFGDGQPGRTEKCVMDEYGKCHLDTLAWAAGDVAYQCLKQIYPNGITSIEFSNAADDFISLVCDDIYPEFLIAAEAKNFDIRPNGIEGLKATWAEYDWCERVMFMFDFIDNVLPPDRYFDNPLNTVLPLVLLQRLDDAVIAEFIDGRGLTDVMLEIGGLRDRLKPPKHVQRVIETADEALGKLAAFKQARRKGADAIHAENRAMKAVVFRWLDVQEKFKSNEAAATAITRQQPIAHVTARDWYKEWRKLRSASTP